MHIIFKKDKNNCVENLLFSVILKLLLICCCLCLDSILFSKWVLHI